MSALNAVLADLHDESADLDQRVSALPAEQWETLTPAPGWTIAHQISHLAWTDEVSLLGVVDPERFMSVLADALADPGGFVDSGAKAGLSAGVGRLEFA